MEVCTLAQSHARFVRSCPSSAVPLNFLYLAWVARPGSATESIWSAHPQRTYMYVCLIRLPDVSTDTSAPAQAEHIDKFSALPVWGKDEGLTL